MAQMSRTALPSLADGELTRANQRDTLAGVVPLERRDQLATLLEGRNGDRRFISGQARQAVQGARRLGLARGTTGARPASAPAALRRSPQSGRPTENTRLTAVTQPMAGKRDASR